ncbi:hypothetical protein N0Y54_26100 [Nostoc punctiforme UO1]
MGKGKFKPFPLSPFPQNPKSIGRCCFISLVPVSTMFVALAIARE